MDDQTKIRDTETTFRDLLDAAITHPGTVSAAYSAFHNYSMGNQMLAYLQCAGRGLPIGPLASFGRWKDLGRHVLKGSKAIELCMPITMRRKGDDSAAPAQADAAPATFTKFVFRRNWFVLAQTDGQPYVAPPLPDWDKARALSALDITEIPYALLNGNCQGYAIGRTVAVSTIATHPEKTLLHEIAHVLLGHTAEATMTDSEKTPRDIREVEAESVAMLVSAVLNLPGLSDSRGYIQAWNQGGDVISEHSAKRIYKATDQILKAGRPAAPVTQEAGI